MSIFELVLLILVALLLVIAAVFAVLAALQVTQVSGYDSDAKLRTAHKWLTWASVVGWLGVIIIIVMVVVYINQQSKSSAHGKDVSSNWVLRFFLFSTLAILIIMGIFSAIGAVDIDKSGKSEEAKKTGAQRSANAATVLALMGGGLVLIAFIVSLFNKGTAKKEAEAEKGKGKPGEKGILEKLGLGGEGEGGILSTLEADPELLLA